MLCKEENVTNWTQRPVTWNFSLQNIFLQASVWEPAAASDSEMTVVRQMLPAVENGTIFF